LLMSALAKKRIVEGAPFRNEPNDAADTAVGKASAVRIDVVSLVLAEPTPQWPARDLWPFLEECPV